MAKTMKAKGPTKCKRKAKATKPKGEGPQILSKKTEEVRVLHPNAAGIDIGSTELWVSVGEEQKVHVFKSFTDDVIDLVKLLKEYKVDSVAMEATGSYWMVLHEYLEAAQIKVSVINGAHLKYVPGRKSDMNDCQWIQFCHRCGLLDSSFVPPAEIRKLRTYQRLRDDHKGHASGAIQLMHKALDQMNIKVHTVISQIMGVSGLRIVEAILAGERNPVKLADLCDKQIQKTKRERLERSLKGTWREEFIFALGQALQTYQYYQRQMVACDAEIEKQLNKIIADKPPQETEVGQQEAAKEPRKEVRHNRPHIDQLGQKLLRLTDGRDATTIPGFTDKTFLKLISEVGLDMTRWKSAKHFTSWLGLAPKHSQSGKKRRHLYHTHKNHAGQVFRMAATPLGRDCDVGLSGFYRRKKFQKCSGIAIMATARKLAVMYYNLMIHGKDFVEHGLAAWEQARQEKEEKKLKQKAAEHGYELVPIPTSYNLKTAPVS